MRAARSRDAVDVILAQWRKERPDLDVTPMALIGRVKRCAALLEQRLTPTFAEFGLSDWEFDMLATLRRAGAPYQLVPTALFSALMVTSGTMTHRIKTLESRGLVRRLPHPEDARSVRVQLTEEGFALIDRAVRAHVENERAILAPLARADARMLNARLSALLAVLEPQEAASPRAAPPARSAPTRRARARP